MSLSDREKAVKNALETRKANFLAEVAKIEEELSQFVEAVVEKAKPSPAKKAPAKESEAPAEAPPADAKA